MQVCDCFSRAWTFVVSTCCTLCACGQLAVGKHKTDTHTLSRWFIADISASHFAMRRRSAPGHSRASGCTKGRSAWLGQCKHPIQNALYIRAGHTHTLTRTHTEVMVLACRLHLTQLYCPCVPSLAECAVCGSFVWTAGLKTPGSRARTSNISWLALRSPVMGKHHP